MGRISGTKASFSSILYTHTHRILDRARNRTKKDLGATKGKKVASHTRTAHRTRRTHGGFHSLPNSDSDDDDDRTITNLAGTSIRPIPRAEVRERTNDRSSHSIHSCGILFFSRVFLSVVLFHVELRHSRILCDRISAVRTFCDE